MPCHTNACQNDTGGCMGYLHLTALHEMLHACVVSSGQKQHTETKISGRASGDASTYLELLLSSLHCDGARSAVPACRIQRSEHKPMKAYTSLARIHHGTRQGEHVALYDSAFRGGVAPVSLAMSGSRSTVVVGHCYGTLTAFTTERGCASRSWITAGVKHLHLFRSTFHVAVTAAVAQSARAEGSSSIHCYRINVSLQ